MRAFKNSEIDSAALDHIQKLIFIDSAVSTAQFWLNGVNDTDEAWLSGAIDTAELWLSGVIGDLKLEYLGKSAIFYYIYDNFRVWIRSLGGDVWWKKTESKNLVRQSL
jgi:hypothetical protein